MSIQLFDLDIVIHFTANLLHLTIGGHIIIIAFFRLVLSAKNYGICFLNSSLAQQPSRRFPKETLV